MAAAAILFFILGEIWSCDVSGDGPLNKHTKFYENISNRYGAIAIGRNTEKWPAAILDLRKWALWRHRHVGKVEFYRRTKFQHSATKNGRVIPNFQKSKMASAAILYFILSEIWSCDHTGHDSYDTHTKFQEDISNRCRVTAIFVNSRWPPTAILDLKNAHHDVMGMSAVSNSICVQNFSPLRRKTAELWKIFENPRWRPPPSWNWSRPLKDHPRCTFCGPNKPVKFHDVTTICSGNIAISILSLIWLGISYTGQNRK